MTFFNKKEEVLDIQLTSYGKRQLAKGKFKPKFYAFFDDNILYDSEYANFTEEQNLVEPRIQESTVSLRSQASYESPEFNLQSISENQSTANKHHSLIYPLGASSISSEYSPAWDIKFMKGEISGSVKHLTGSHQPLLIPQIDVDITYKTLIKGQGENVQLGQDVFPDLQGNVGDMFFGDRKVLISRVFDDGTYVEVIQSPILVDIFESNTEFEMENVEIEFFEVENIDVSGSIQNLGSTTDNLTKKRALRPLKFKRKISNIQNDLLVPEDPDLFNNVEVDSSYVEYYLDVLVDREIPSFEICEGISNVKSRGVDIDSAYVDYECDEQELEREKFDIYGTNIVEETEAPCEDNKDCQE